MTFVLTKTNNGAFERNIVYDCFSNVYDEYLKAVNETKRKEDYNIYLCDKDLSVIARAIAVVCKQDDDICVMLESINGGYYGLFRTGHTKRFATLGALRDYLFNIDYQTTNAII